MKGITEQISIAWENEFNWCLPNVIGKCLILTSYKQNLNKFCLLGWIELDELDSEEIIL